MFEIYNNVEATLKPVKIKLDIHINQTKSFGEQSSDLRLIGDSVPKNSK